MISSAKSGEASSWRRAPHPGPASASLKPLLSHPSSLHTHPTHPSRSPAPAASNNTPLRLHTAPVPPSLTPPLPILIDHRGNRKESTEEAAHASPPAKPPPAIPPPPSPRRPLPHQHHPFSQHHPPLGLFHQPLIPLHSLLHCPPAKPRPHRSLRSSKKMPPMPRVSPLWGIWKYSSQLAFILSYQAGSWRSHTAWGGRWRGGRKEETPRGGG